MAFKTLHIVQGLCSCVCYRGQVSVWRQPGAPWSPRIVLGAICLSMTFTEIKKTTEIDCTKFKGIDAESRPGPWEIQLSFLSPIGTPFEMRILIESMMFQKIPEPLKAKSLGCSLLGNANLIYKKQKIYGIRERPKPPEISPNMCWLIYRLSIDYP